MGKTCFLLLWGSLDPRDIEAMKNRGPEDAIYCADSGYDSLQSHAIIPDVVIGDFDSTAAKEFPKGVRCERVPSEKDDTDGLLTAKIAFANGYRSFRILGGLAGRLDHTIGNIGILAWLLENGAEAVLRDGESEVRLLREGELSLLEEGGKYLSVFPYTDFCKGVTLSGVKYPLSDAKMEKHIPIGVSNEIIGEAKIAVKKGTLLLIRAPMG